MQHIPILVYHSVGTDCAPAYGRWMVTGLKLSDHLKVLKDKGYRFASVSQLAARLASPDADLGRTAVVTFDDGLRDYMTGAMPVLERHGAQSTLYVVSGQVGKTSAWLSSLGEGGRPMLNWQELRDIAKSNVEIGGHTVSHPELDVVPAVRAYREIVDCKRELEQGLGQEVRSFAYPHGYSNARVREIVRDAGYSSACRVAHAFASPADHVHALSRIIMTSEITAAGLSQLLDGRGLPVSPPVERLASRGWRAYRRSRSKIRRLLVPGAAN
jgi:peptidoglycan/xylan/chitin deacetylase (PgdA/CDA1 family)